MFEKLEHCPVCNSREFKSHIICKDYLVSGESFAITRCTQCNFLFTNPRPTADIISNYYDSDQYISHSNKNITFTDFLYKVVRNFTLVKKQNLVSQNTKKNRILDYGCGTGHFLKTCKSRGWKICGVEPNETARKQAEDLTGEPIVQGIDQLPADKKYHAITMWHVLEHIYDLNSTFEKLTRLINKSGRFFIAVPNVESLDAKIYGEYWAAYDVPRHLYHFSQDTMKKFLARHDLKLKKTIPMKFDSYYISLLSEKYKCKSDNYIKSFISGYKSNSYAKNHQNNYSSLIYVAGK